MFLMHCCQCQSWLAVLLIADRVLYKFIITVLFFSCCPNLVTRAKSPIIQWLAILDQLLACLDGKVQKDELEGRQ